MAGIEIAQFSTTLRALRLQVHQMGPEDQLIPVDVEILAHEMGSKAFLNLLAHR